MRRGEERRGEERRGEERRGEEREERRGEENVEISNRFAALRSSDKVEELDVNSVWEYIRDNIKIAVVWSIGYYETKKKKPWFDETCFMVVERRKQAKLKFLQDPVETNRDNYFNERREASRTLRNKKRGYLKEKLNEIETNSKNKNIRDLYKGIKEFKNGAPGKSLRTGDSGVYAPTTAVMLAVAGTYARNKTHEKLLSTDTLVDGKDTTSENNTIRLDEHHSDVTSPMLSKR
ncbi:hypothetical protein ANN_09697 [Periplaneta americana]|uniref:Uncharacterized protein n=1 Tax=Periplaneta americana TaxID=6978 RepID=A0ABQ8TMC9_PERAM|nr:hypothetical protein ANN_09697 [Periplaneta americana]